MRLWLSAASAFEPSGKSQDTGTGGSSQPSFSLGHSAVQATKLMEGKGLTLFFLLFTLQGAKTLSVSSGEYPGEVLSGCWDLARTEEDKGLSVVPDVM